MEFMNGFSKKMKEIIIASKNPVKINAVKMAFEKVFSEEDFKFEGASIPSNVSDQPIGNEEIITGASNRAKNAMISFPDADFWVGIEGGIEKTKYGVGSFSWVVVKSKNKEGKAKGNIFFLPKKVVELIDQGKELGDADDIVFGGSNSKQKNGSVGILTGDIVTRTDYYYSALVLALIPFKNPNLY